jgi:hypothetical protein
MSREGAADARRMKRWSRRKPAVGKEETDARSDDCLEEKASKAGSSQLVAGVADIDGICNGLQFAGASSGCLRYTTSGDFLPRCFL